MTMQEDRSREGIVDSETFRLWYADYFANTRRRLQAEYGPEGDYDILFLDNVPWNEVPESLQAILGEEYTATQAPEASGPKSVSLELESSSIRIRLNSPWVFEDIDTFGEHATHPIILGIEPDHLSPRPLTNIISGHWSLSADKSLSREFKRRQAAVANPIAYLNERERLAKVSRIASLASFQDLAGLLTRSVGSVMPADSTG